jgi:hypothetical protein
VEQMEPRRHTKPTESPLKEKVRFLPLVRISTRRVPAIRYDVFVTAVAGAMAEKPLKNADPGHY